MQKLYELSFDWNNFLFSFILFIIFIIIGIIVLTVHNRPISKYNLDFSDVPIIGNLLATRNLRKEQAILAFIFTIILFCVFLFMTVKNTFYIYHNYNNNNYDIVVGEVTKFNAGGSATNKVESFYIEDIKFEYSKSDSYGYHKTKNDGGVIIGDGQKLRIGYIKSKTQNIIVSIEQIE